MLDICLSWCYGLPAFVVAPEEVDVGGVHDLVECEQEEGLETVVAAVDVVPQKQILGLRWFPSYIPPQIPIWMSLSRS